VIPCTVLDFASPVFSTAVNKSEDASQIHSQPETQFHSRRDRRVRGTRIPRGRRPRSIKTTIEVLTRVLPHFGFIWPDLSQPKFVRSDCSIWPRLIIIHVRNDVAQGCSFIGYRSDHPSKSSRDSQCYHGARSSGFFLWNYVTAYKLCACLLSGQYSGRQDGVDQALSSLRVSTLDASLSLDFMNGILLKCLSFLCIVVIFTFSTLRWFFYGPILGGDRRYLGNPEVSYTSFLNFNKHHWLHHKYHFDNDVSCSIDVLWHGCNCQCDWRAAEYTMPNSSN
jgi:hypothetical protein